MRSTPFTSTIRAVSYYELHDQAGTVLGNADSRPEGVRMLQAFVMTAPGREADLWLVGLASDGSEVGREDIFDIGFGPT
jgi:hypothetical protein